MRKEIIGICIWCDYDKCNRIKKQKRRKCRKFRETVKSKSHKASLRQKEKMGRYD